MAGNKLKVVFLTLSAVALIGIATNEGYVDTASIPTAGDVPTVGFGSTKHSDGSSVKLGERIDPVNALKTMGSHISKDEAAFRDSLPGVEMNQASYDTWLAFVYQFGISNWLKSSMRVDLLAGNETKACDDLLKYKYAAGYDCSTPGNKRCYGVWTRQLKRHKACLDALG